MEVNLKGITLQVLHNDSDLLIAVIRTPGPYSRVEISYHKNDKTIEVYRYEDGTVGGVGDFRSSVHLPKNYYEMIISILDGELDHLSDMVYNL